MKCMLIYKCNKQNKGGINMKKERFLTTITPEAKKKLRLLAAEQDKKMNEVLEELIIENYDKSKVK